MSSKEKSKVARLFDVFYQLKLLFRLSVPDMLPSDPQEVSPHGGDDVFRRLEACDGYD
jgi:hypothetical protein